MPELPDITAYVEAIDARARGRVLESVRVRGVSLLRTVEPTVESLEGRRVEGVERLGMRVVLALGGDLFVVVHLMIARRFRWIEGDESAAKGVGLRSSGVSNSKIEQARFVFGAGGLAQGNRVVVVGRCESEREDPSPPSAPPRSPEPSPRAQCSTGRGTTPNMQSAGTLVLIESGTKKRATMHVVRGREALATMHAGGVDVFEVSARAFIERLRSMPRTLKRALTDPRLVDGIGNAYSDEILHAAGLSPVARVSGASDEQLARLHAAAREVLSRWTDRLRRELKGRFPTPTQVTAFRPDFAVHGKFGKPCPVCGTKVQRIVYAEHECNYCPTCQCGGRVLADRSLSRLLRDDWPRTAEELE